MDSSTKKYFRYYSAPIFCGVLFVLTFCDFGAAGLLTAFLCISGLFLAFRKKRKIQLHFADWLVLGLLLIETTSSYINNPGLYAKTHLFGLFMNTLMYFTLRFLLQKNKQETLFTNVLAGFTILMAILTVGSYYLFKFNVEYEGFTDIVNFKSMFTPLGFLLNDWVTILFFSSAFVLLALIRSRIYRLWFWLLFAGLGVVLMSIVFSFSRGAYLSIAVGLLIFLSMGLVFKVVPIKKMFLFVGCATLLVSLTILPAHKAFRVTWGMSETVSQQRSTEGRLQLWGAAMKVFQENPFWGVGQKQFSLRANPSLSKKEDATFTGRVTNSYFQLLAEKGVIGLIPWLALVGLLIILLLSVIRLKHKKNLSALALFAVLTAVMFRELSFSTFFEVTQMQLLFFASAAIIIRWVAKESIKYSLPACLLPGFLFVLFVLFATIQIRYQIASKKNDRFVEKYLSQNYRDALADINQAIRLDQNNPLLNSNKGVLLYVMKEKDSTGTRFAERSLKYLQLAVTHSPYDPYFHHNLAWHYLAEGKKDSADVHFRNASELSTNTALFHISRGLFQEKAGTADCGLSEFKQAIRLSPDVLDSEFVIGIKIKNQEWVKNMLQELTDSLSIKLRRNNSPILKSRLAKILLTAGDTLNAVKLFEEAGRQLPNLDRPWYYRGMIKLAQKDTLTFLKYLNRAMMLDPVDYRYPLALADYYYQKNNKNDAIIYYMTALVNRKRIYTQHSMIAPKWYGYKTPPNTILPGNLLAQISPAFDHEKVCNKLSELYNNLGKANEARLVEKYKNEEITINQLLTELNRNR